MVLKSRLLAPDWSADGDPDREALCRKFALPDDHDVSKDPWFHDMDEARHICNGTYSGIVCPFRDVCAARALVNNEGHGVFGGLLPIQRKWIRRNVAKFLWTEPDSWAPLTNHSGAWFHLVPPPEDFEEEDAEEEH